MWASEMRVCVCVRESVCMCGGRRQRQTVFEVRMQVVRTQFTTERDSLMQCAE